MNRWSAPSLIIALGLATTLQAATGAIDPRAEVERLAQAAVVSQNQPALRGAAAAIVAMRGGAQALARFNAGEEAQALDALEAARAARERARRRPAPADLAGEAAEARAIAVLATEARGRGRQTTDQMIARYETVVRLAPGGFADWMVLGGLYRDAGRQDDALRAWATASRVAPTDPERVQALKTLDRFALDAGSLGGATDALGEGLDAFRRLAAPPQNGAPKSAERSRDLALALLFRGYGLGVKGDQTGAVASLREGARLAYTFGAGDPADVAVQGFVGVALSSLGATLANQGDLAGAASADRGARAVFQRLANANPSDDHWPVMSDASLGALAEVLAAQGDLLGARRAYEDLLVHVAARAAAAPARKALRLALIQTLNQTANVAIAQGDGKGARGLMDRAVAAARALVAADGVDPEARTVLAAELANRADVAGLKGKAPSPAATVAVAASARPPAPAPHPTAVQPTVERDAVLTMKTAVARFAQGDITGARGGLFAASMALRGGRGAAVGTALQGLLTSGAPLSWRDIGVQAEALARLGLLGEDDITWLRFVRQKAGAAAHKPPGG